MTLLLGQVLDLCDCGPVVAPAKQRCMCSKKLDDSGSPIATGWYAHIPRPGDMNTCTLSDHSAASVAPPKAAFACNHEHC